MDFLYKSISEVFNNVEGKNSLIIALVGVVIGFLLTIVAGFLNSFLSNVKNKHLAREMLVLQLDKNLEIYNDNLRLVYSDLKGINENPRTIEITPCIPLIIINTDVLYTHARFSAYEAFVIAKNLDVINHVNSRINSIISHQNEISISIYATSDQKITDRLMVLREENDKILEKNMAHQIKEIELISSRIKVNFFMRFLLGLVPLFVWKKLLSKYKSSGK